MGMESGWTGTEAQDYSANVVDEITGLTAQARLAQQGGLVVPFGHSDRICVLHQLPSGPPVKRTAFS